MEQELGLCTEQWTPSPRRHQSGLCKCHGSSGQVSPLRFTSSVPLTLDLLKKSLPHCVRFGESLP